MIALLAAVPFESELTRRRLAPCEVLDCGGFELYRGRLAGRAVTLLHTGVGKANAAAAATALVLLQRPQRLILFGCGGAFAGSGLAPGDLALASREIFGDEGAVTPDGFLDLEALGFPLLRRGSARYFNTFPLDPVGQAEALPRLQQFCRERGRRLALGPFVTVSTCSGSDPVAVQLETRSGGICENMEGAAVAAVCLRYGLPLLELRGISNRVGDRDLAAWDLRGGAAVAEEALLALLAGEERHEEPA